MIKIDKKGSPLELIKQEKRKIKHCEDYDSAPDDYMRGKKCFGFGKAYKLKAVKIALYKRQYNKCCFSEAKFEGDSPHVEHFRPKGRVDIYNTNEDLYPGYYWLAYEWSNLFYCKEIINSGYKRNFFPLYNENERNRNHHDSFTERSLLIDPSIEEPRNFIRFIEDEPKGIDVEGRGLFNIILLGLRDTTFVEARSKKLIALQLLKDTVDLCLNTGLSITGPIVAPLIESLEQTKQPDAEYSSMAIDFLSGWPPLQSYQNMLENP